MCWVTFERKNFVKMGQLNMQINSQWPISIPKSAYGEPDSTTRTDHQNMTEETGQPDTGSLETADH